MGMPPRASSSRFWLAIVAVIAAATLVLHVAEARNKPGSGGSIGQQRPAATPHPTAPDAAAPAQPAQPAPQREGLSRWLGPFAGIAIGLGLAGLLGHDAGNVVAAILCAGVLIALVAFLMRWMTRAPPSTAAVGTNGAQYSSYGEETVPAPPPSQLMTQPIAAAVLMKPRTRVPEGFDSEGFLRGAKRKFIELYEAHDLADFATLREFTTDEMFIELKRDIEARSASSRPMDIVTLGADLLEVVTDGGIHWASIRFSGMLRDDRNAPPSAFEEVWNLRKPASGRGGWVLAGIQQVG
jgi:predicted lipid-binding transport protein (Tim44 family)